MKVERSENIGEFEELCEGHPYINKPTENREDRDFFVLKNNKNRVGCAYIRSFFKKIGTIGAVFVKEGWRREGFGSFLIEKLEDEHRRNEVWIILVGVQKENEVGFKFWRDKGYEVLINSVNEPLVKNPIDVGILEKISPVPVPNNSVSILGKPLPESDMEEDRDIRDEFSDFSESIEEFFRNAV